MLVWGKGKEQDKVEHRERKDKVNFPVRKKEEVAVFVSF